MQRNAAQNKQVKEKILRLKQSHPLGFFELSLKCMNPNYVFRNNRSQQDATELELIDESHHCKLETLTTLVNEGFINPPKSSWK